MFGLVLMAMRLADKRMEEQGELSRISHDGQYRVPPVPKGSAMLRPNVYPASYEYYQIIWRLSNGKPA